MKFVNTKVERSDEAKAIAPAQSNSSGPDYEYGLRISLSKEMLEKLGLDVGGLTVGQEVKVAGVGHISGISSSEYDGHTSKDVSIQLIEVGVEPKSKAAKEFEDAWDE